MTCKAGGGDLDPIPWEPPAITELPKVIEGDPDGWSLWDAAVIEQDRGLTRKEP